MAALEDVVGVAGDGGRDGRVGTKAASRAVRKGNSTKEVWTSYLSEEDSVQEKLKDEALKVYRELAIDVQGPERGKGGYGRRCTKEIKVIFFT